MGWRDGRRDSQRKDGEVAAAAVAIGDDEAQSRRQRAVRLGFELVRRDGFARGRVEAGEDHP